MQSAPAAIAWEFGRRHRWGLVAIAGYLVMVGAIRALALDWSQRVAFKNAESFAFTIIVPLTAASLYFLAVFSFGLAGDLSARQSMYPRRMFTLPVSNAALAGWPMLYGSAAMALLWFAMRFIAVWPAGFEIPVIWPALLGASLVAWTQALNWMPYGLPGLRVAVSVLWLTSIDAVVMLALEFKPGEPVMLALLAPHVPLAYLAAYYAVSRARRDDTPDWRHLFARSSRDAGQRVDRPHFSSPMRAQVWLEWKRYGRSLPALVAILLPFELAMLFLFRDTPVLVFEIIALALLTPALMASFVAATVSRADVEARDSYNISPFIATRPMTNASLVRAKMQATIWSTLASWVFPAVAIPAAVQLSGTAPTVRGWIETLISFMGVARGSAMIVVVIAALLIATWSQLVHTIYIGLSGRAWLVKGSVFTTLTLLTFLMPLVHFTLTNRRVFAVVWNGFPWILAIAVCVKVVLAAWVMIRLYDERIFSARSLLIAAAVWDIAVFALYGVLAWMIPVFVARLYIFALFAILAIPFTRILAAPLALTRNRHR